MKRTGPARVREVEARRPRAVTVVGGPDPMPVDLRNLIRAAIDEQRRREQG